MSNLLADFEHQLLLLLKEQRDAIKEQVETMKAVSAKLSTLEKHSLSGMFLTSILRAQKSDKFQ